MSQFERVYKIDRFLRGRVPPTKQRIMDDWVRASQWHPGRQLEELSGGAVLPRDPNHQDQEILMDILGHGADVEVLAPEALRQHVAETLRTAAEQYWLTKRTASRAQSLPSRRSAEVG
jgi:predicted DNA-binding transcriptional regulator YafY